MNKDAVKHTTLYCFYLDFIKEEIVLLGGYTNICRRYKHSNNSSLNLPVNIDIFSVVLESERTEGNPWCSKTWTTNQKLQKHGQSIQNRFSQLLNAEEDNQVEIGAYLDVSSVDR